MPIKKTMEKGTLFCESLKLLKENGRICTSLIQRVLCVGYAPAREIMDDLIRCGIITEKNYMGHAIVDISKYIKEE